MPGGTRAAVKAALADKAVVQEGAFEISRPGKFKARATVNAQNLVEKVESWIDNPVLGDMPVVEGREVEIG